MRGKKPLIFFFIILLLAVVNKEINAQNAPVVELEEVVVTPRRSAAGFSQATENVTVVTQEELKGLPAKNLSEALSYIAGVDIEPRQGFARATSISIQGSDSRQVRVMVDGIPFNSLASGQVDPTRLPIENIERIEIIKGSASSVWGSGLGGVVNIITKETKPGSKLEGSLTNSLAEFRTKKHSADLSSGTKRIGAYFFSSYMESGGKGFKNDVLEKKSFAKLSFDLEEMGKITSSFGLSEADVNSGVFPDGSFQSQPYRLGYGKVCWGANIEDLEFGIDLKHSRHRFVTRTFDSQDLQTPLSEVSVKDLLYELSLNTSIRPFGRDLLVLGADFDYGVLKSSFLTKAKNIKLAAPYVNYTLNKEPFSINCGLRYDHNSEFGEAVSPSLGFLYHFNDLRGTLARFAVARAFSAPPLLWKHFEERLSSITTNPDIKPERAWVYEFGLETKPIKRLSAKLSLYRSLVTDAISLAENAEGKFFMKNFEEFRRQGAELQFTLKANDYLNFFAAGAFNDIVDKATGQTVRGGGKPRQSFDLGIEFKSKFGFNAYLKGYYDRWNQPADFSPNDRKMIFDLRLLQEFKYVSIFLNTYNLTNSSYWADIFFPIPERYFEGGMTLKW